jgi:hypothetical protein
MIHPVNFLTPQFWLKLSCLLRVSSILACVTALRIIQKSRWILNAIICINKKNNDGCFVAACAAGGKHQTASSHKPQLVPANADGFVMM